MGSHSDDIIRFQIRSVYKPTGRSCGNFCSLRGILVIRIQIISEFTYSGINTSLRIRKEIDTVKLIIDGKFIAQTGLIITSRCILLTMLHQSAKILLQILLGQIRLKLILLAGCNKADVLFHHVRCLLNRFLVGIDDCVR